MDILFNSVHVLRQDSWLILLILAFALWGAVIIFALLKRGAPESSPDAALFALSLAGWPFPVLLLSLFLIVLRSVLAASPAALLTVLAAVAGVIAALGSLRGRITFGIGLPLVAFIALGFIRLGFIAGALLPPYFDSAEHYRIIQSLLELRPGRALIWPPLSYYHLGYHVIAAALVTLTGAPLARLMLILGQLILAGLPLPMYFFVHRATGSKTAALIGLTLASFGWSMPAHAVNWGKYPALMALLLLQLALGLAVLNRRRLLIASVLIAMLIHTRSIVLSGLVAAAWLASRLRRPLFILLSVALLGAELLLVLRDPTLVEVLGPYAGWVALLVALLSVLGIPAFPRLVFASLLAIALLLGAMLVPLGPTLSILDRPLVEMTLFLPLAFLGGLGAARLPRALRAILALAVLVNAFATFSFSPSGCCQLAGADDVVAFNWMKAHLPARARLGIAAEDLRLTSSGLPLQGAGSDGGIWIEPLTGLTTISLSRFTDFRDARVHDRLCRQRISYLYVGGTGASFNIEPALALSDWYAVIFALPEARVIRVSGC